MSWNCKPVGAYARTSNEAQENALEIYSVLYYRGWTLEAVCGMLGNVEAESGYNPWRWQNDSVLEVGSPRINYQNSHAYGLCQWDPAGKYINNGSGYSGYGPNYSNQSGSLNDGYAQMCYLDEQADYYSTANYPLSYAQYKTATISNYSIAYLTRAWFYNFERGTWSSVRETAADYWYTVLSGNPPPQPPIPTPGNKIPIWLMFKLKERSDV